MSTVLWANRLDESTVVSDEADKPALHRHLSRLDRVAEKAGLAPLSAWCDTTDLRFNLQDLELPEGMTSTHEWMAAAGVWVEADEAVRGLTALIGVIEGQRPRFGVLRDEREAVLAELRESLAFARAASVDGARFNFSVVM